MGTELAVLADVDDIRANEAMPSGGMAGQSMNSVIAAGLKLSG
ncbi:hypothetical protein [Peterkaempfera sp. SMS 1(5)a]